MLAALIGEKRRKYVHLVGVLCAVSFGLIGYLVFGSILLLIFMAFFAWQNWEVFRDIVS